MNQNDEGRRQDAPATNRTVTSQDTRIDRCPTCDGWLTRHCPICRGFPDVGVSIERIARGITQVDSAFGRARARDLLRDLAVSFGTAS